MAKISIGLIGDKELIDAFDRLTYQSQKKVFRPAARAAAKVILPIAKSLAPRDTGAMASTLMVRAIKSGRRQRLKVVGARVMTGTKAKLGIAHDTRWYYPAHVELGHKKRGGGKVEERPFLRDALDQGRAKALAALKAKIRQGLNQMARQG